jgi:hypothetical protein
MAVEESLSLITTFYDYFCCILFYHYSFLYIASELKEDQKPTQNEWDGPTFRRELWESICKL